MLDSGRSVEVSLEMGVVVGTSAALGRTVV